MNCKEFQEKISLYIDDELNNIEKKEFELHLLQCEDCQREYKAMIEVLKLLNDTEDEELPGEFKSNLRAGLVKAKEETFRPKVNWKMVTSVAASFIIFLVSYGIMNNNFFNNNVKEEKSEINQLDIADSKEEAVESKDKMNNEVADKSKPENRYGIMGEPEKLSPAPTVDYDLSLTAKEDLIARRANVNIEVSDGDDALKNLKEHVSNKEGDIENLTINNDSVMKNISLTVSLKDKDLEETVEKVGSLGELINSNIIKMDVEKEILTARNNLKNLKLQEKKLASILRDSNDVNERLKIESEITRIKTLIDNYTYIINKYEDNDINSILDVNMRQIKEN